MHHSTHRLLQIRSYFTFVNLFLITIVTNSIGQPCQSYSYTTAQDAPPLIYNGISGPSTPYDFSNTSLQNGAASNLGCPYIAARFGTVNIEGQGEFTFIEEDPELHETAISEDEIPVNNNEGRQMAAAEQLANGNGINSNLTEPQLRLYVAQQQLYQFLNVPKNKWLAKSSRLQQFVANGKNASFGTIDSISKNIVLNKIALAQQQLANWNKTNRVEENYAKFFNWTILRRQKKPINLAEIEQLAQQCPQTDGNVVFAAQNLYNAITNKHKLFTTTCNFKPDTTKSKQAGSKQLIATLEENETIKLYPNPTKDMVNIAGKGIKKVELLDAYGKLLNTKIVDFSIVTMPLNRLSNGLYFIRITNNDGSVAVRKIVKY